MIDKMLINSRFINAVNSLISEKIENKGSISEKINISKSKFSEILNGRMNIGLEDLANFCEQFNIDSNLILVGNHFYQNQVEEKQHLLNDPGAIIGHENIELIETQRELILTQKKYIAQLEAKNIIDDPGNANAS